MASEERSTTAPLTSLPSSPNLRLCIWASLRAAFLGLFCLFSFLLGRSSRHPGSARTGDQIVAEVLWATGVARTHLRTFVPQSTNVSALNAALHDAILRDHSAFTHSSTSANFSTLNDDFFHYQVGSKGDDPSERLKSLHHRSLPEFQLVSRAVALVADRLLGKMRQPSTVSRNTSDKVPSFSRSLQAWATVHTSGSTHERHDHEEATLAVVYYVTVGEQGGILRLYDPRGPEPPFDGVVELRPLEGEIMAFPGWLEHEVAPGGDDARVSIAFNVKGAWAYSTEMDVSRVGLGRWEGGVKGWTLDWGGPLAFDFASKPKAGRDELR